MQAHIDDQALLALWERALAQPPARRGDALLPGDAVCTLGERNTRLAGLHAELFGERIELLSCCPACGAAAEFGADCGQLMGAQQADARGEHHAALLGHEIGFRLPQAADVAAASHDDDTLFARRLLQACVLSSTCGGEAVPPTELPLAVLDALSQRMESLDPAASLTFAVACPQCSAPWEARLDLAALVWQKLQAAAERLLLDIDTLARRYGWSEHEVLSLSRTRRAAYLQLAGAP